MSYAPGGRLLTTMPNAEAPYWAPKIAPTSARAPPYAATPTNLGALPSVGNAHRCRVSTPGPKVAPRSMAHPLTWNPDAGTVAPETGLSRAISGSLIVMVTARDRLNVPATVLWRGGAK